MLIIRSQPNAQRKRIRVSLELVLSKSRPLCEARALTHCADLDVASAPLKLLPDHAEERCIGQRGQWKRFLCSANGDDRSAFNVDWSAAIQRQVHWIIGMTRFDFDDRLIGDDDRAVRKNVRANRRDDEHAGLRVENRSSGLQRIRGGPCRSRDN